MLGEAVKTAKDIVERRAEHAAKLEDVESARFFFNLGASLQACVGCQ
jgi:hypothetical protein